MAHVGVDGALHSPFYVWVGDVDWCNIVCIAMSVIEAHRETSEPPPPHLLPKAFTSGAVMSRADDVEFTSVTLSRTQGARVPIFSDHSGSLGPRARVRRMPILRWTVRGVSAPLGANDPTGDIDGEETDSAPEKGGEAAPGVQVGDGDLDVVLLAENEPVAVFNIPPQFNMVWSRARPASAEPAVATGSLHGGSHTTIQAMVSQAITKAAIDSDVALDVHVFDMPSELAGAAAEHTPGSVLIEVVADAAVDDGLEEFEGSELSAAAISTPVVPSDPRVAGTRTEVSQPMVIAPPSLPPHAHIFAPHPRVTPMQPRPHRVPPQDHPPRRPYAHGKSNARKAYPHVESRCWATHKVRCMFGQHQGLRRTVSSPDYSVRLTSARRIPNGMVSAIDALGVLMDPMCDGFSSHGTISMGHVYAWDWLFQIMLSRPT